MWSMFENGCAGENAQHWIRLLLFYKYSSVGAVCAWLAADYQMYSFDISVCKQSSYSDLGVFLFLKNT